MITFERDKKTGELRVLKDGKPHGKIVTLGDKVTNVPEEKQKRAKE